MTGETLLALSDGYILFMAFADGSNSRASFGREVMALMPRLRAVVSPVIGTDRIDEEAATELRIIVANGQFPEHYQSLAEANVMLMLVCLYDLHVREAILRHNLPRPPHPTGRMMAGKLVGMIGFGHIARAIELKAVLAEVGSIYRCLKQSRGRADGLWTFFRF